MLRRFFTGITLKGILIAIGNTVVATILFCYFLYKALLYLDIRVFKVLLKRRR